MVLHHGLSIINTTWLSYAAA